MFIECVLEKVSDRAMPPFSNARAGMVNEMEDSSMFWCGGLGGCVEGERSHEQDFALFRQAGNFAAGGDHVGNCRGFQDSQKMGGGANPERAVGVITVIQMETHREELLENPGGRPCVVDALFDGRDRESGRGDAFCEGKHQVLMPCDLPIRGGCFIESDGLDRNGARGKMAGCDEIMFEVPRGFAN